MAAIDEHQKLVNALVIRFVNDGLEIENADLEGYEEPYKIGRHEPDIIARNVSEDLVVIGEAKNCADLTSDRSREQFQDFSNAAMREGKSQGHSVPFYIVVQKNCASHAASVLAQLNVNNKPNVTLLQYGIE
ncbi:MAG TPA: hypothetical protein VLV31_01640 [Candidatus Acidoferrales bacterium]|nr:hypothetical protein [Candidatus Acidoferrales bacterium]